MDDLQSRTYVEEVLEQDDKIIAKLDAAHNEPDRVYPIFKERLDLYEKAMKMPISYMYLLYFRHKRDVILTQSAVVAARKDFDDQISQIMSRIDNFENDIKTIKDKLNIAK